MKLHSSMVMFGLLASIGSSSAWAYDTTFPASTFGSVGSEIAGVDGWTINDPGFYGSTATVVPRVETTMSYANQLPNDGTSLAAELGGYYDYPQDGTLATVVLSHATPNQLQDVAFRVDFLIEPSIAQYPGRDGFGFSFRDASSNNLIRISLTPATNASNDAYQVSYTVGNSTPVNAMDVSSNPIYIFENTVHTLSLAVTPNGADPTFSVKLVSHDINGNIASTTTFAGKATGLGSANVDSFAAEWNLIAAGSNGLVFDNLRVGEVQPVQLAVTSSGSNLNFSWPSRAGKTYNLRTSTDLATAPASWELVPGDIAATPALNVLSFPRPADTKRFYVIQEWLAPN